MKKINFKDIKHFVKVNPFNSLMYGAIGVGLGINITNIASRGKIGLEDILALGALGFATLVNTGNAIYRMRGYNSAKKDIEKDGFQPLDFHDSYRKKFAKIYAEEHEKVDEFNAALTNYANSYQHFL